MGKVNVVIVDATGNKEQKVGLPDDIKCGIIMVKLVEKIKLPSVGPDGNPISYKFIHKVTGRQLLEAQTLAEAGVRDGDVLRLQPEITAGAFCTNCGNNEADGNTFCSKCGSAIAAPTAVPTYAPVPPAAPAAEGKDISKLIFLIGVISAGVYLFAQMIILFSLSYGSGAYRFFSFIACSGQAGFMFDVVLYMLNRLKK